jgi:hypothetical protein
VNNPPLRDLGFDRFVRVLAFAAGDVRFPLPRKAFDCVFRRARAAIADPPRIPAAFRCNLGQAYSKLRATELPAFAASGASHPAVRRSCCGAIGPDATRKRLQRPALAITLTHRIRDIPARFIAGSGVLCSIQ